MHIQRVVLCTWLLVIFILLPAKHSHAQALPDTVEVLKKDTVRHSSKKATLLSTFLPGAGQIYNKKYWKLPIIYGGLGTLIYVISFNQNYYHTFKNAYTQRVVKGDSSTYPQYTSGDLLTLRDYYRRNRDLSYIITGVVYVLNIIDAYVDAELFKFDISDNLSMRGEPFMLTFPGNSTLAGLRLTLNF